MVFSFGELLDPGLVSDEEALEIAGARALYREAFGPELARFVGQYLESHQITACVVERAFVLVEAAAQPAHYFWLVRAALAHADSFVRSAGISLLRRQMKNEGWVQKLASDADQLVRASLMEALWQSSAEMEQILASGTLDSSPIVAANATFGLYLLDPGRNLEAVQKLVSHRIPLFRCAAAALIGKAAVIGKMNAACRGQLLKPLLTDSDASVRHAAFQTVSAIKAATQAAA